MNENDLSYLIRGAAFKVHSALGPGLLESVYEVQIFPNPTTGLIKVVSDKVIGEVEIYNSMGIQVQAYQTDLKEMTIDLSNLIKGVYYLRMNIENKTQVHKIIVL